MYSRNLCFWRSPRVGESVFQNLVNFCWWNPESGKILLVDEESWALESRIQLKEFRNPLHDWNPESKFYWQRLASSTCNPESTAWIGIQNPRLSWIPLWGEFRSSSTRNQLNARGGRYSANIWVWVSRWGFETLTLFRTKNSWNTYPV